VALDAGTLVVGASAAGLATAAQLQARGVGFEVVEAGPRVAMAWRGHYDRLRLHTPRSISGLPGLAMPRSWGQYPSRDQVVRYLEVYCRHFGLQPHFDEPAVRVARVDGAWETTTRSRVWRTRNVVLATGRTRIPVRPVWPGMGGFVGKVLHSSEYRNGEPWRGRVVLVVGFGNSACEQALDLTEHGAKVHLSVRSPVNVVPRDVLGVVPVLQLGILMRPLPPVVADILAAPLVRLTVGDVRRVGLRKLAYGPNTQIARDHHIPLLDIGTMAKLRSGEIAVHPGIDHFTATGVVFDDDASLDLDAVVLGTGYRAGFDDFLVGWEAVCDESGTPRQSGFEVAPGLYCCGKHVSPAGMLREIALESRRVAAAIASSTPTATSTSAPTTG